MINQTLNMCCSMDFLLEIINNNPVSIELIDLTEENNPVSPEWLNNQESNNPTDHSHYNLIWSNNPYNPYFP